MKKRTLFIVTLTLSFCTTSALASGNRVGNGGDAIVCGKKKKTAEILDFYEVETLDRTKAEAKEKPAEILAKRFAELKRIHPALASVFENRLASIEAEIEMKKNAKLVDVEDSLHDVVPSDPTCSFVQAAIRRHEPAPDQKRFVFDDSVWRLLDARSKAGLLAHEIIYEYFYKLGDKDSRKARAMNRLIFSKDFGKMTEAEYWKWIKTQKLPLYPEAA